MREQVGGSQVIAKKTESSFNHKSPLATERGDTSVSVLGWLMISKRVDTKKKKQEKITHSLPPLNYLLC